jgi:hypothetical protein
VRGLDAVATFLDDPFIDHSAQRSGYVTLEAPELLRQIPLYSYHPMLARIIGLPVDIQGWDTWSLPEPTVWDTASVFALAVGLAHQDEAARRVKLVKR